MPNQIPLNTDLIKQKAAERAASGASTKNTVTSAPAQTSQPKSVSPGDISDAFKGTAQFKPAPQQQTYIPSTGQTFTGQQSVEALKNTGGTSQQIAQAQQNVNQQAAKQPLKPTSQVVAESAQKAQQALNPNATPQQLAISQISQQKGVSPDSAFSTPEGAARYQNRVSGNAPAPDSQQPAQQTVQQNPQQPTSASQQQENTLPSNLPPNSPNQFSQTTSQTPVQTGNQTMISQTNSQGQANFVTPEEAHQNDLNSSLVSEGNKSMEDQMNSILEAPAGTSAAELLKQNLLVELGMINDPAVNQMLDDSAQRAKASYESGLLLTQSGLDEIDKAIDGTLTAPTTASGLQAKIAKEGKEQQLTAIKDEQDYQQKTHDLQMGPLRDNRDRLEGYTKAKLESMGALDSSAGITLLSKISQSADLQIEQANLDYDHNHQQLVMKSTQVMSDYTNNISSLVQQTNAQKATYLEDFNKTMDSIDEKRLSSQQAKQQMRIQAFTKYNDKSAALQAQEKQEKLDYLKQAYEQQKDLQDRAFKMSGMMGTVFMPDENGSLVDTGVPTFDNKKNTQDYMMKVAGFSLDQAKFGLQQQQFGFDQQKFAKTYALDAQRVQLQMTADHRADVNQFLDLAKAEIDPHQKNQIEQMMGMPQGMLNQFGGNKSAIQGFVNSYADKADSALQKMNANSPSVASSPNLQQVFNVGGHGGQCGTWASTISTATRVGNTWAEKRTHIDKRDNPQPGDKLLIPAGVKSDGAGWGHVAVVTGFDSNTGTINIVDSNWDMKGTIRQGSFNVNDLNKKYGGDWGYASGTLRPQVMQQLQTLPPEDLAQTTYTPPGAMNSTSNMSGNNGLLIDFTKFPNPKKDDKPTSDTERQAAGFTVRSEKAEQDLNKALTDVDLSSFSGSAGFAKELYSPNFLKSEKTQEYEQASRNFISAVLRKESGAAISDQEYTNESKKYIPQPGDSKEVIQQKAEARKLAIQNLKFDSGKAYDQYQEQFGDTAVPTIKSNIQKSLSLGMDKSQIFQQLVMGPMATQVTQAIQQGATPDSIIDHYLNN